jgi:glycosyltransferase involved in cell wall biosynthesis
MAMLVVGPSIAGGGGTERRVTRSIVEVLARKRLDQPVVLACESSLLSELVIVAPGLQALVADGRLVHANVDRVKVCGFVSPSRLRRVLLSHGVSRIYLPEVQRSMLPALLDRTFNSAFDMSCSVTSSILSCGLSSGLFSQFALQVQCRHAKRIDCLYDYFLDTFPRWKDKCMITPCSFTDYEMFRPLQKERSIVFAGRMISEKQPLLALDAFALARRRLPSALAGWRLLMFGQGELVDAVRRRIRILDLDGVASLNSQMDLAETLGRSSVFLSLQIHENYPSQSLIEALACDCVPVCTDVGETRRVVTPEVGVLVRENTPDAIADAILTACARSSSSDERGSRRAHVMASHSAAASAQYFDRFLGLTTDLAGLG